MNGVIFNIKRFALHDGPGIRTTVFLKGCAMRCPWCHNPESQKKEPERISKKEVIGEYQSVEQIMREIEKEEIFYNESQGGVTFSGGEPLEQPKFLKALLRRCQEKDIHTALDTAGYVSPKIFNSIIDHVDLFLFDLKFINKERHIQCIGIPNDNVIENLKILDQKKKEVILRFPVIPSITDDEENIKDIASFVSSLKTIKTLSLLPYHRTAESKYQKLKMNNMLKELNIKPPSENHMREVKLLFEKYSNPELEIKYE